MEFEKAVSIILKFEGGYVNNEHDAGGETKYGICKKSYPHLEIETLSIDDAKEIYKRDFWDRHDLDSFPSLLRLAFFDAAVNCGGGSACRFLQTALGLNVDGILGRQTLKKLAEAEPGVLLRDFMTARQRHNEGLSSYRYFGKGWDHRLKLITECSLS